MKKIAYGESMFQLTQEICGKLQEYFFQLEHLCLYPLSMEADIDMSAIFKAIDVKCDMYSNDFFENLTEYIKIVSNLLDKRLFILINIRSYIDDEQLKQLLKEAAYIEVNLLLIENQKRSCLFGLAEYIIDCDSCEI